MAGLQPAATRLEGSDAHTACRSRANLIAPGAMAVGNGGADPLRQLG